MLMEGRGWGNGEIVRGNRRGEGIGCRQEGQGKNNCALGVLLAGVLRVEPVDNAGQIAPLYGSIDLIWAGTGNAIAACAVTVVVVIAAGKVGWPSADRFGNARYLESPRQIRRGRDY